MTNVEQICNEYYGLYRGQDTAITSDSREYAIAINLLKQAVRKWDRADGQLWRELNTSLSLEKVLDPALVNTITSIATAAPSNIRKPPAFVTFTLTDGRTAKYTVDNPENSSSTSVWFLGGTGTGWVMYIGNDLLETLTDATFDYQYIKSPTQPTTAAAGATTFIEMSDPSFAVHYMLALRFQNARNGFGYQTAMNEAKEALANMKIENNTGTLDSTTYMTPDSGWGMPVGINTDIRLS
jgi:hypothetical protein